MTMTTKNRCIYLFQLGLLVGMAICLSTLDFSHLHHTWTLQQVKDNTSCSSPCAVTVASTGSGNLLVAGLISGTTAQTITAVTAGACSGSWVISASTAFSTTGVGSGEMAYCLSSISGQTSISITFSSGAAGSMGLIWEASSSTGGIALDTGATPAGNNAVVSCTACAGPSLSLSASNKFIAVSAACAGTCSNLTGTGFVNDLSNPNTDGVGHGINIATSGTLVSPTSWTMTNANLDDNAIAFKEAAAGGTTGINRMRKYDRYGLIAYRKKG